MNRLRQACQRILRDNDRGQYTVPSSRLYPHQWAWDSAFTAIGWAHLDPPRARLELQTLLAAQWPDGRVPHIVFHQQDAAYEPGPAFWGGGGTSSISQPPIWTTAARRIVERHGDDDWIDELLPRLEASHRFFRDQRDPLGWNLVAVVHPWESGLDNCPAWDQPLARVKLPAEMTFRRVDREIVDASVRPTDAQYGRFAALVQAITHDDFGPGGQFSVYDPLISAVLCRAEDDLAWLAERRGVKSEARARARQMRQALVARLWDDELGRFVYHDALAGQRIDCDVIGCYLPLWCGVERAHASRLVDGLRRRYWTRWPLPSTAPGTPCFEPRRYWRGPSWVNVNWLLAESLGRELVARTLELVKQSGCWEYYHPRTGEGLGGPAFSWTAALALDLLESSPIPSGPLASSSPGRRRPAGRQGGADQPP